jgi:hypothetical protein
MLSFCDRSHVSPLHISPYSIPAMKVSPAPIGLVVRQSNIGREYLAALTGDILNYLETLRRISWTMYDVIQLGLQAHGSVLTPCTAKKRPVEGCQLLQSFSRPEALYALRVREDCFRTHSSAICQCSL